MMAKHSILTPAAKAMLDVYVAKRRSEISPTVGSTTDVFFIAAEGVRDLDYRITNKLESIYQNLETRTQQVMREASDVTTQFFGDFLQGRHEHQTPEEVQRELLLDTSQPKRKRRGRRTPQVEEF
jgi:hypothetical protein